MSVFKFVGSDNWVSFYWNQWSSSDLKQLQVYPAFTFSVYVAIMW